ncbi:hypothetical protein ABIC09_001268 [Bradyrhizobium sp. S3.12.5]
MRFRCANRISIFLRSRRDVSKPLVPESDRVTSRACSCSFGYQALRRAALPRGGLEPIRQLPHIGPALGGGTLLSFLLLGFDTDFGKAVLFEKAI